MNLLGTIKLVSSVISKVVELHQAGVPQEIITDVHEVVKQLKDVVDKHHEKHVDK